jgi:serine/threonine-protein kinase HSL1 (negative regulator of Swe1 kinase)
MTKTYSTCNFSQIKSKGYGRQVSRFTVISNAAETERSYDPFKASKPQHLDAMRETEGAKVTIHHDQDTGEDKASLKMRIPSKVSVNSAADRGRQKLVHPRMYASRSSIASSSRSRGSAAYSRAAIVGRKRGVSFAHLRPSGESGINISPYSPRSARAGRHSNHTEVTDDGGDTLRPVNIISASTRYIRSRKEQMVASQSFLAVPKNGRGSQIWTEDMRQLSSSLAKDCDEAFNRTSIVSTSRSTAPSPTELEMASNVKASSASKSLAATARKLKRASLETRPLPPPPVRSDSVRIQLLEYRKQAELRKHSGGDDSPGHVDRMVSHIDRLIQPSSPTQACSDRRATSAPMEAKYRAPGRPLPSIHEARGEDSFPRKPSVSRKELGNSGHGEAKSSRVASAPEPRITTRQYLDDSLSKPGSRIRDTIRVVQPSSPGSPVKVPAPLTIRKKSSKGGGVPMMSGGLDYDDDEKTLNYRTSTLELRQQYNAGAKFEGPSELERIDEDHNNNHDDNFGHDTSTGTIIRKKSSWFRRNSRSGSVELKIQEGASDSLHSQGSSKTAADDHDNPSLPRSPKNKGFSLRRLFKKRNSKSDMTVSRMFTRANISNDYTRLTMLLAYDIFDDNTSTQVSIVEAQRQSHAGRATNHDDPRIRQIEPQQNWLAKLFHVKPASKYICFSVNRRRARQEITTVLREWRRYGIRDIQVDKERNIVFGKVAAKNCEHEKSLIFNLPN